MPGAGTEKTHPSFISTFKKRDLDGEGTLFGEDQDGERIVHEKTAYQVGFVWMRSDDQINYANSSR